MSNLTAAVVLSGEIDGISFTELSCYRNRAVYSTGLRM